MPRFVSQRDFDFFQHINKEIILDVVDVPVVLYKIIPDITSINIYGESTNKARYRGINLQGLIKYTKRTPETEDGFGYDVKQTDVEFRFATKLLQDVNVYPDVGDIIGFNSNYYEINNITEAQLIANRPDYSHNVICQTHLTRRTSLNIEETHI